MRRLIERVANRTRPPRDTKGKGRKAGKRRGQPRTGAVLGGWAVRFGLPLVLLGSVAAAGAWAWQSGWAARQATQAGTALIQASANAGLAVQEVFVEGRDRTAPNEVLAALGGVSRGSPILAVATAEARSRLEALPWVAHATVERRLPDEIHVRLDERRPMAIWQHRGRLQVIDTEGLPIRGIEPGRYAELPLVVGQDAPADAARLLRVIQGEPELAARMDAAVRVGERRWNVRLDNRVEVQLPEEDMAEAWSQLARMEAGEAILQRDVRVIDLRLPDRMVVRVGPDAEPEAETMPEPGQST